MNIRNLRFVSVCQVSCFCKSDKESTECDDSCQETKGVLVCIFKDRVKNTHSSISEDDVYSYLQNPSITGEVREELEKADIAIGEKAA